MSPARPAGNAAGSPRVQSKIMRALAASTLSLLVGVGSAAAQPPLLPGGDADKAAPPAPDAPTLPGTAAPPTGPLSPRAPAVKRDVRPTRPGERRSVDRVVAVVNDSVILSSEMMRRVAPLSSD